MVDHRNSGSELHRVPGGKLLQWTPRSHPAARLPAAICGQRPSLGERICASVDGVDTDHLRLEGGVVTEPRYFCLNVPR